MARRSKQPRTQHETRRGPKDPEQEDVRRASRRNFALCPFCGSDDISNRHCCDCDADFDDFPLDEESDHEVID
jgi:hypothetical protein